MVSLLLSHGYLYAQGKVNECLCLCDFRYIQGSLATLEMCDSLEAETVFKVVWKCVMVKTGALFVMMNGQMSMLMLSVANWDIHI